jgi:hypothetical protein
MSTSAFKPIRSITKSPTNTMSENSLNNLKRVVSSTEIIPNVESPPQEPTPTPTPTPTLYYMKYSITQPNPTNKKENITTEVVCSFKSKEDYMMYFSDAHEGELGWDELVKAGNRIVGVFDGYGNEDNDDDYSSYPDHSIEQMGEIPPTPTPTAHLYLEGNEDIMKYITVKYFVEKVAKKKQVKKN